MWTYLLGAAPVALVLWLPGALAFVLLQRKHPEEFATRVAFRAYAHVYGLGCLGAICLLADVLLPAVLGVRVERWVGLTAYLLALGGLGGWVLLAGRTTVLRTLVVDARGALTAYLAFALLCAALAAHAVPNPIAHLEWQHVAAKTFGLQPTHDNYFQFVNGKAIAEHVSFDTLYDANRLVYPVTSREMLPGVLYAGWRHVLRGISTAWEDAFAWYLLFGIACNAMLVLALDALRVGLRLRMSLLMLLCLLSTSAFFLVNGYFTWFKLAAAALFLSGVAVLLVTPNVRGWATAGGLWGLSAGMHLGSALGFPLVALWALWRTHTSLPASAGRLAAMTAVFSVVMLPWQIVKAVYFPPDLLLLQGHYLDGHFGRGLGESIAAFVASTPWQAQVSHRLQSVVVALRLPEVAQLIAGRQEPAGEHWLTWLPRYRFAYAATLLYPVGLGALAASAFGPPRHDAPESRQLIAVMLLTLLAGILLHYSSWCADWSPHLPLGPLVLAYVLLADRCLAWRWTRLALVAWVVAEGTLTVTALLMGVGQTGLVGSCGSPGVCGNDLMMYRPGRFFLWDPWP